MTIPAGDMFGPHDDSTATPDVVAPAQPAEHQFAAHTSRTTAAHMTTVSRACRIVAAAGLFVIASTVNASICSAQSAPSVRVTPPPQNPTLEQALPKARHGDSRAQYTVGMMYLLGQGATQSLHEGSRWIQLSAHAKVPMAMLALAALYDVGVTVPFDSTHATQLREEAARAGLTFARTQLKDDSTTRGQRDFRRADMLTDFRMYTMALSFARKSADAGNARGQLLLGRAYHFGFGVPVDHAAAFALYQKSAAGGLADGARAVGYMYEFGVSVPLSRPQALTFYDLAAQRGSESARVNARLLRAPGYDRTAQAARGVGKSGADDGEFQRFRCSGAGGTWNGSNCYEPNSTRLMTP